ncbi:hypothetical protein [Chondromyces crocatus]|nr:hypothetical protein [Chondromyces crocatus]
MAILLRRTAPSGVRMELRPARQVTAAQEIVLPAFDGWVAGGELLVRCAGVCEEPFSAALELDGVRLSESVAASLSEGTQSAAEPGRRSFSLELAVPLSLLDRGPGGARTLSLLVRHPARSVPIAHLRLPALAAPGPMVSSLDLLDVTDALLVDAPERRLFDLQNPEEGLWVGTGRVRLRLLAAWSEASPSHYSLDGRPTQVTHRFLRQGDATDVVVEDPGRRGVLAGRYTTTELSLDTSNPDLGPIPEEGRDVPLDVVAQHALTFTEPAARPGGQPQQHAVVCAWSAELPVRLRDPRPLLRTFQRLSAVGIDFGTTATVAALYQKGYRSLLRLGTSSAGTAKPAENPAYLLIEDHERLWSEMARVQTPPEGGAPLRFPDLVRVVRGSHAAYEALAHFPSAVVGELKGLPERVIGLDQSPQLRDRERQRDFLLDEVRVRALVRAYAYLLGRAINRPGQDVYLQYRLTHPAKFDERARAILEEEIRQGLLLSIPEGIPAEEVSVSMSASEPEAFAAEVCPELAAHPALEPLIERFGELRFAVFDFGGGTLDIACGRFRPATSEEQEQHGTSTVIETLQTGGDDHLGGDYLTHELTWLSHQSDVALREMEQKEVPMMRPQTVPPNNLANKPHLYKRSLAARQNRYRFERELNLEQVKFGPDMAPSKAPGLVAARLDGSEVAVESFGGALEPLTAELRDHLRARIREGVKLMKNMLAIAPFGAVDGGSSGRGDFLDQGVVILLAGNSSRSRYVERALADELGIADLKVWRPESNEPFSQVVLYETQPRTERGVSIVGVTPKTAVSLGALKIANHEVLLVRRSQGFSYFLGDLRGFPPKFKAIVPMGTKVSDPSVLGEHYIDFGRWDAKTPLRAAKEYEPNRMTSSDPRLLMVPTGLPPGAVGRLYVCVASPDEVVLHLEREGQEPARSLVSLAKLTR